MQIGAFIVLGTVEEMKVKLETLRKHGFETCMLNSWNPDKWTDENAKAYKAMFEEYGITISAFWCGWEGPIRGLWNFYGGPISLGLVPVEYRYARMKNLCDGADFAHKLGVTDVITHMGFIPEDPNDPRFNGLCVAIREVAKHLKENGQYLLFETGQETPVTMIRCFEEVGMDNLGVNFDTANLLSYGKANPVDALDLLGPYVRNLHAKDGDYPKNGHELGKEKKIGQGSVDFHGVFRKLQKLGYDSHIAIEREIPEGPEQLQDIIEARAYLQKIWDEVLEASL